MSKLSRTGYGLSVSPAAYTDATSGELTALPPTPRLALHEYRPRDDGGIDHLIDGELRATVPAEGLDDYARVWPDSRELAGELRRPADRGASSMSSDAGAAIASSGAAAIASSEASGAAAIAGKPSKKGKRR